jgi:hypothetical protein
MLSAVSRSARVQVSLYLYHFTVMKLNSHSKFSRSRLFFLSFQVGRRFASGTPLSVLDPVGSTTIEQAYKNIDEKLKVSNLSSFNLVCIH